MCVCTVYACVCVFVFACTFKIIISFCRATRHTQAKAKNRLKPENTIQTTWSKNKSHTHTHTNTQKYVRLPSVVLIALSYRTPVFFLIFIPSENNLLIISSSLEFLLFLFLRWCLLLVLSVSLCVCLYKCRENFQNIILLHSTCVWFLNVFCVLVARNNQQQQKIQYTNIIIVIFFPVHRCRSTKTVVMTLKYNTGPKKNELNDDTKHLLMTMQ